MKIDPKVKTLAVDVAERTVWTYLEAFAAALILTPVLDISTLKAAAISGVAAGLTYLKTTIAALRPGTVTPASTAAVPVPPAPPAPVVVEPVPEEPVAQPPPPPPVDPASLYDGPVGMFVDGPSALLDVSEQTKSP